MTDKYVQDPIPGLEEIGEGAKVESVQVVSDPVNPNATFTVEPAPQPECASCHGLGAGVVSDAVQRLKERITADKAWTSVLVDAEDLSVVLTALERHHSS